MPQALGALPPAAARTTSPRLAFVDKDTLLIDLFYDGQPRTVGAYLLLGDAPLLVETGPATTYPQLVAGLRLAGLKPSDLHAVLVTHIHLDHAGALGELVGACPHLKVYAHPLGTPHLVDPSRLMRSARRVFGALLDSRFGEPAPVPEANIHTLDGGEEVSIAGRRLRAVATPGHAAHHLAFFDEARGWLFTGDVAGCALPDGAYVHPPTPAPEVDLAAWRESISRMRSLNADRILYSHFGWTDTPGEALDALESELERRALLVKEALEEGLSDEAVVARFAAAVDDAVEANVGPVLAARHLLLGDASINAPGLIRYWRKQGLGKGART